jgi:hypothetical protein
MCLQTCYKMNTGQVATSGRLLLFLTGSVCFLIQASSGGVCRQSTPSRSKLYSLLTLSSKSYVGNAVAQRDVGSIPDCAMEFFIDLNPSDSTMALGSTQPLTEMSTRSISWG